jgi:hypothetical protein
MRSMQLLILFVCLFIVCYFVVNGVVLIVLTSVTDQK